VGREKFVTLIIGGAEGKRPRELHKNQHNRYAKEPAKVMIWKTGTASAHVAIKRVASGIMQTLMLEETKNRNKRAKREGTFATMLKRHGDERKPSKNHKDSYKRHSAEEGFRRINKKKDGLLPQPTVSSFIHRDGAREGRKENEDVGVCEP